MVFPNLIIAGPPKSGTTSLFRYLADHPNVCPSSIKEIHYFERYRSDISEKTLAQYESYFDNCESIHSIRLEASPRYLQGGKPIAELINSYLPGIKLIFIIREPVSRFYSRFISAQTKTDIIPSDADMDVLLDEVLSEEGAIPNAENPICEEGVLEYLWQGYYSGFLTEYLKIFPKENICIAFFDELSENPKKFVEKICRFAGIQPDFYSSYEFNIENRTRIVKYKRIHKLAISFNRNLEGYQNNHPSIRKLLRDVYYNLFNPEEKSKKNQISEYAKKSLEEYYFLSNQELKGIVQDKYPGEFLPGWLESDRYNT